MPIGPVDAVDGDLVYHVLEGRRWCFRYNGEICKWLAVWCKPGIEEGI